MSDRDRCRDCSFLGRNNTCEHPIPSWAGPSIIMNPELLHDCATFTPIIRSKDLKRFTRVLVYEGPPEKINECIKHRMVKGSHSVAGLTIKEGIIGDFVDAAN